MVTGTLWLHLDESLRSRPQWLRHRPRPGTRRLGQKAIVAAGHYLFNCCVTSLGTNTPQECSQGLEANLGVGVLGNDPTKRGDDIDAQRLVLARLTGQGMDGMAANPRYRVTERGEEHLG